MTHTDPLTPEREQEIREVVQHSRGWAAAPSTWTRMLHDVLGELDRLRAVVSPPTGRADLRERIAAAIHADLTSTAYRRDGGLLGIVPRLADAVLAVLPEQADRAAWLEQAASIAEDVAESLRKHHEFERSNGALDVMTELRRLAVEAQSCRWEHPHPGYQCEPSTTVEAHDTGTQQPETPPAEVEWLVQTRWHDGDWRDWSRRAERTEAEDEYDRARDGKHDWRLVRVTTSYAIEAATEPAPVAQQPAAEVKHTGGNAEDCPVCRPEIDKTVLYPWICRGAEQQAAAADGEERTPCSSRPCNPAADELCDAHAASHYHRLGEHAFCGPDCDAP